MALGTILREARERQNLTPAQVAETTRMMQQIVEDLEVENFRRIAAPIYGKSFIKMYAACVGLDPAPLIEEF
ncbi:MAG: helix-turn-helix domain-containing protein, partial [Kiritimatiellaeota bacterium]|nr:helix-turn-helix domain-containing protein [Kiritimatiellota bacterium]